MIFQNDYPVNHLFVY